MLALGVVVACGSEKHFSPRTRTDGGVQAYRWSAAQCAWPRRSSARAARFGVALVNGSGERTDGLSTSGSSSSASQRAIPVVWFIALGLVTSVLGFSALRAWSAASAMPMWRRSYIACCAAAVVGLALFASAPDAATQSPACS
jgi:hypothetical protein